MQPTPSGVSCTLVGGGEGEGTTCCPNSVSSLAFHTLPLCPWVTLCRLLLSSTTCFLIRPLPSTREDHEALLGHTSSLSPAQRPLSLWSAFRPRPGANRGGGLLCAAPLARARARCCSSSQPCTPFFVRAACQAVSRVPSESANRLYTKETNITLRCWILTHPGLSRPSPAQIRRSCSHLKMMCVIIVCCLVLRLAPVRQLPAAVSCCLPPHLQPAGAVCCSAAPLLPSLLTSPSCRQS